MTHINSFGELNYEVGDYIKIKKDFFTANYNGSTFVKIINKDDSDVPYSCELSNGLDFWVSYYTIERRMTQKEIEQYNFECSTNKYNL